MAETPRAVLVALMMLTFVTGVVDAVSVLSLGRVFTANMTGNVVFLGFALVGQGNVSVASSLNALGSFMLGALTGGRISKDASPRAVKLAFGVEVFMLAMATVVGLLARETATVAMVSFLAFAMGLRNAVIRKLAIPDMTTTVLTLTVTGLAADSGLAGGTSSRWPRRVLSVAMMLGGAAFGASLLPFGEAYVVGAAAAVECVAVGVLARQTALRG